MLKLTYIRIFDRGFIIFCLDLKHKILWITKSYFKNINQFSSKDITEPLHLFIDTRNLSFYQSDLPNEEHQKENINPDTTIWCSNDYLNMSHNEKLLIG